MTKVKGIMAPALAAVLIASAGLFGCSASENEQKDETTDMQEADEEPTYAEIGTDSDSATQVQLTNATGKTITNIAVKASTDEAYPEGIMTSSQKWADDETVIAFF